MAAKILPNEYRDAAITAFRKRLMEKMNVTPLLHQARWFAATDGLILLDVPVPEGEGERVRLADNSIISLATIVRPHGRARVVADLGAYKVGKSFGGALFAASFGCIPNARVSLVGLEYDICEPEFDYICEFLLSERGLGMTHKSLADRPRDGKMWLDLPNGCRFEARSWERKDALKGKEIDAYIMCEAYQLPGLECYTDFAQNLRARNGFAIMATTPDRPWVDELHQHGHFQDPLFEAWHCTCDVPGSANPFTFDAALMERDRTLMTEEKFSIHHLGKLGRFVGSVYGFQRGEKVFTPTSHPSLFRSSGPRAIESAGPDPQVHRFRPTEPRLEDLRLPGGWELVAGADTGTFSSALVVAFSDIGDAYVLAEFPNYRYVAGKPELLDQTTIPSWSHAVVSTLTQLAMRPLAWADQNSQWKREVQNYGLTLLGNPIPIETRTDIAREYFQHARIYLASWLSVLPFELENAKWPEEASAAGRYARVKDRDHTLDCLEHVLSRRPKGKPLPEAPPERTWAEAMGYRRAGRLVNPHLGNR